MAFVDFPDSIGVQLGADWLDHNGYDVGRQFAVRLVDQSANTLWYNSNGYMPSPAGDLSMRLVHSAPMKTIAVYVPGGAVLAATVSEAGDWTFGDVYNGAPSLSSIDTDYVDASATFNPGVFSFLREGFSWAIAACGRCSLYNGVSLAARGRSMVIYDRFAIAACGRCSLYNASATAARGRSAVYRSMDIAARGRTAVCNAVMLAARGRHRVYNKLAAALRGRHAVCLQIDASLRGRSRAACAADERWELYRGVDAAPDLDAAPWETFTSSPHVTAALGLPPSGTRAYHFVAQRRNRFGLVSRNRAATIIEIDAAGEQVSDRPSAPGQYGIEAIAGGVRITAAYAYDADAPAARADSWLLYISDDGSDPLLAVPVEEAMVRVDGVARLAYDMAEPAAGVTFKAVVRIRHSGVAPDPDIDSQNTGVVEAETSNDAPAAPDRAAAFFGLTAAQAEY